jgi:hypothetical protein
LNEGGFLDDLLAWRYDVGHNAEYYEPVTSTSLIARECMPFCLSSRPC